MKKKKEKRFGPATLDSITRFLFAALKTQTSRAMYVSVLENVFLLTVCGGVILSLDRRLLATAALNFHTASVRFHHAHVLKSKHTTLPSSGPPGVMRGRWDGKIRDADRRAHAHTLALV